MSRAGRFVPVATELRFGERGTLPALDLDLPSGRSLRLEGRIDRVDLCEQPDRTQALVFDYKRSGGSARFDLGRWYHGLSLQTVLYALVLEDVTLCGRPVQRCVGAFLLPVEVPLASQRFGETLSAAFLRKARGLFDGSAAGDLDLQPERRGSRYYAFYSKQGEGPYGRMRDSSAVRPDSYRRILRHTEQTLQALATRILDGEIPVQPYAMGTESPCTYCDYRSLCKFDWQITPPRQLTKWGRIEVLQRLEQSDD
jgi:ATP-dependent helicase/nuclease subunit B